MSLAEWYVNKWKELYAKPIAVTKWVAEKGGNLLNRGKEKELPVRVDDPNPQTQISIEYNQTTVSYSSQYIFNRSGPTRTPRLDPNFPSPPPQIPDRRLPEVEDNQSPFLTPIGQSLTIRQALTNREYGNLLHRPINQKTLEIEANTGFWDEEAIQNDQEFAARKIAEWYDSQQRGEVPDIKIALYDSAMLFFPEILKGFQGDQGVVFGQKIIHKIGENYAVSSENAYQDIDCFVYPKIIVTEKKPILQRDYRDTEENLQIISLSNLSRLYYLLGADKFKDGSIEFNFDTFLEENIKTFWEDEEKKETKDMKVDSIFGYWEAMTLSMIYRLGLNEFPNDVNGTLFAFSDDEKDKRTIHSLTDYIDWYIDNFDALIGEWPIETEITDTDLLKEGNQTEIVSHPNIAETLAETFKLTREAAIQGDLAINFLARLSCEAVAIKNLGTVNQSYLQSLYSAMGFKGNRKRIRMQYNFNPKGAERVDDLLDNSEQSVIGVKCEDKSELWTYLENLMFAANIIKQVFFRKGDNTGLEESGIERVKERESGEFDDAWDKFTDDLKRQDSILNKSAIPKPDYKR